MYVHDGLHHLPNPLIGVREMLGVARVAVAISEPTPSVATQVAVRSRSQRTLRRPATSYAGSTRRCYLAWPSRQGLPGLRRRRYRLFSRDGAGVTTRLLSTRPVYPAARVACRLAMWASAPVGNKLVFAAIRDEAA